MDPRFSSIPLVFLLVAGALSGCAGATSKSAELLVKSQPVEVHSVADTNTTTVAASQPVNVEKGKSVGHIAGVVVDSGIHPLAGVSVRIPALDLTHPTDRDGVFSFTDLYPGPYYLIVNVTGYETAQTIVQVDPDAFVRVKFILNPLPPPTPYHSTTKYEGFADVSSDPFSDIFFGGSFTCGGCDFSYFPDPLARTFILEATMDDYQWNGTVPSGANSFQYSISKPSCCGYNDGQGPNPMRVEITSEHMPEGDVRLVISPAAFPLPETSKAFEVFVTAWYNSDPPPDWSIVGGDT